MSDVVPSQFTLSIESAEQMQRFAGQIAACMQQTTIIYLQGDLGVGKTTFAQGFGRALGVQAKMKSPSYTLVETYQGAMGISLNHLDLYRIRDISELEYLGLADLSAVNEHFTSIWLVEWPQHGVGLLPAADLVIEIKISSKIERLMTLVATSEVGEAVLACTGLSK